MQVIELCVCHLLRCSGRILNGALHFVPGITRTGKQCVHRCDIRFIEYGGDDVLLFSGGHPVHRSIQVSQDIVHGTHIPLRVIHLKPQGLDTVGGLIRRCLQRHDDITKMRTAFSSLDTVVGKDTKCGIQFCRSTFDGLGCTTDGQDCLAQLGHRGVCGGGCLCHLVHHRSGFIHSHTESRHCIRYHVRCGCKFNITCGSKIQYRGQGIAHLLRVIASQCQVVQGLGTLGSRKGCL